MPIGLSPENTVRVCLASDVAAYPDEKARPAFLVRFPSARQRVKVANLFEQFDAEKDRDRKIDILVEAARVLVERWENIDGMTWENIADKLTFDELDELTTNMIEKTLLTEIERGKSGSAQRSGTADCASNADPKAAV